MMLSSVDLPQPDGPQQGHELLGLHREVHLAQRHHVAAATIRATRH